MRRLDNRGFAFSTILYGLMLLGIMIIFVIMSTMQTNRQTNKDFVKKIEDELNRFSLTNTNLSSTGSSTDSQEYIVPIGESGWYKIELWGAAGGGESNNGGYGSYTSGLIWLEENRHLYFYIGNKGNCSSAIDTPFAIFNGAGNRGTTSGSCFGGGATDVRLRDGAWSDNLDYRIMVAAGGGGAGLKNNGNSKGGPGGGIIGYYGKYSSTYGTYNAYGLFGSGQNGGTGSVGGGGGGYFGGTAGNSNNIAGGGGSSYIAGYGGVRSRNQSGAEIALNKAALDEHNLSVQSKSNHTYDVGDLNAYFVNGLILPGVNLGSGSAKITKISSGGRDNPPTIYNEAFTKKVKKITDCYTNISNGSKRISEIQAIYRGVNYLYNASDARLNGDINDTTTFSGECVDYTLNTNSYLDEVAVFHEGRTNQGNNNKVHVTKHTITLTYEDNSTKQLASAGAGSYEFNETSAGLHYSAWNPLPGNTIADGVYYIQSAIGDAHFLTKTSDGQVKIRLFTGENNQKWSINSLGNGYYKISCLMDLNNNNTLQIADGAEYSGSDINIAEFVGSRVGGFDWEKWRFEDGGSGTFYIVSGFNTRLASSDVSYSSILDTNPNSTKSLKSLTAFNGGSNYQNNAQRFKIINAVY